MFPFTVVAGVHAMDSVATLQRDVWAVRITKRLGSENSVVTCIDWCIQTVWRGFTQGCAWCAGLPIIPVAAVCAVDVDLYKGYDNW